MSDSIFTGAVLNPNSGEVALNMKQVIEDNSADSRRRTSNNGSHDNAWESFRYAVAQDAQVIKHLAQVNLLVASQTGSTENQQSVTPIRSGAGDALASAAYPANRAIDTSDATVSVAAAGVATANQAIADALAQFIALMNQGVAALQAVLVTAAGGASTPSQTSTKS